MAETKTKTTRTRTTKTAEQRKAEAAEKEAKEQELQSNREQLNAEIAEEVKFFEAHEGDQAAAAPTPDDPEELEKIATGRTDEQRKVRQPYQEMSNEERQAAGQTDSVVEGAIEYFNPNSGETLVMTRERFQEEDMFRHGWREAQ